MMKPVRIMATRSTRAAKSIMKFSVVRFIMVPIIIELKAFDSNPNIIIGQIEKVQEKIGPGVASGRERL